jgi:hypothetical protein
MDIWVSVNIRGYTNDFALFKCILFFLIFRDALSGT